MNKRERVIAAVEHEETDFVPYHLRFTAKERRAFMEASGTDEPEVYYGNHIDVVRCMDFVKETEPGLFTDEFGVVWDRRDGSDIGLPIGRVLEEPSLSGYSFPSPVEREISAQMAAFVSERWDTFRMVNAGFTLYERGWSLRGIENTLADMLLEEDFLGELFDKIVEYNIAAMDCALKCSDNFDAFYFGDDWGQQRGLIMGAGTWRRLIGPRIAKLIDYAKGRGKYTALHSCGDILELFPDLIDAGLDIYDTFQPEVYNIKEVKRLYGDKLCFLGGISTQTLLPSADAGTVERVTKETLEIMGAGGGYIAAPTHDLPPDIPAENVLAMIRAFGGVPNGY